jgi:RimJ/RimL family protein N-acetyltransferase
MPKLDPDHYSMIQPLFQRLSVFHLCGWAVVNRAAPGEVWVDDVDHPHVAVVEASEGCYLVGDPGYTPAYAAILEAIPTFAYLICDPTEWEQLLHLVWSNPAARRHAREHYTFRGLPAPSWRERVPEGMRLMPVNADFLQLEHLENFSSINAWVGGWRSREDFFQRGAGAALVQGNTITSWSMMDCALDDRCEIGVITDMRFRRRGLGKLVVSAVLEDCLSRGYREIGWQCLHNNTGSKAIARGVGFEKERDYLAFSGFLPAESAGDLTTAEWADWGEHYERFLPEPTWAFMAVQAWSMAGQLERALENLHLLNQIGWKPRPEWVNGNWRLDPLRSNEEARSFLSLPNIATE